MIPSSMYARRGVVRDFDVAAGLLAARPEIADALVTHRFSLDEAEQAFGAARSRDAGSIKVLLET